MEPPKRDFPVIPVSRLDFSRPVPVHLVTGNLPVTKYLSNRELAGYRLPVTGKYSPDFNRRALEKARKIERESQAFMWDESASEPPTWSVPESGE